MPTQQDMFIFMDLETTGLDFTLDRIVEVGWVIASHDFSEISSIQATAVKPVGAAMNRIYDQSVVYEMHKATGLLDILEHAHDEGSEIPLLASVEEEIVTQLEIIEQQAAEEDFELIWHLTGASVHFDLRFIERFMPRLHAKLHHRIVDVSSIKLLLSSMGHRIEAEIGVANIDSEVPPKHRAARDVAEDFFFIQAVRHMVRFEQGVYASSGFGDDRTEETF